MANLFDDYRKMQANLGATPPFMPSGLSALPNAASPGAVAPPMASMGDMGGLSARPNLAAPSQPQIQVVPTPQERNMNRLSDLKANPAGVDRIENPWGRGAARVLDTALRVVAPRIESFIPGTAGNRERNIAQQEGIVANDQDIAKNAQGVKNAQAVEKQVDANAEYLRQRPEIEQSKIDQRQQAVRDRVAQQAASHGQKVTWDENGSPSYEDDPQLLANAAQQAQIQLRDAQTELANSKNDPNSPAYQQAEKKMRIAQANASAAQTRADAYRGNYLLHAKGVDTEGNVLPGAQILDGTPIGTSFQGNVTKSLTGNAQFDDVQQGIDHTTDALTKLHNSGGSLNSPAMIQALSHSSTGLGKWLQSQAAATLTPQERDAVVSVNAMRERILAMRKASGGTASESQVRRMIDMLPGEKTPDLDTAQRQLREVQSQLDTLRPGVPQVNRPGKQSPQPASNQSGPRAGEVVDGYKFKGGNPAQQSSWEKVN